VLAARLLILPAFPPYCPVAVAENQPRQSKTAMTLEEICSRTEAFIAEPDASAFDELAREIFGFQFEHNEPYRRFCESRSVVPARLKSWQEIPAVISSAFKDLEVSALPPASRTNVFHSSGTVYQRPSRHFHSRETLRVYERSLLRGFKANVLPDRARANFLILTPRSEDAPNSSLVYMFETVTRSFADTKEFCAKVNADGGWSVAFEEVLAATQNLAANESAVVICGTAFSFVHLCDFLAQQGEVLSFPAGSRVFETGGYKGRSRTVGKAELHRMISRRLSIPESHIVSEYGMSELSSQAYDRKPGESGERIYHFSPWARAAVLSPETGEVVSEGESGLLRIVDLANVGSVLAVQTEDLARPRGTGFELLGRAEIAEARGCSLMELSS